MIPQTVLRTIVDLMATFIEVHFKDVTSLVLKSNSHSFKY